MNPTGYGPRRDTRWHRLVFDGIESNYELWETKFLAHLRLLKLKDTILPSDEEPDEAKNEECYAELIQLLDDKSLSLVMREADDDGRKALKILREHYASQRKPRVITLYTELTTLEKEGNETITDYLIRAEKPSTALKNAGETLSDGLVMAMVMKGLPESYKPFIVHVTQSSSEINFSTFKCQLKSFEETEKLNAKTKPDQIMKVDSPISATCYGCGRQGHFVRECPNKSETKWCNYHKSTTHSDDNCRRYRGRDKAKKATEIQQSQAAGEPTTSANEHSFVFYVSNSTSKATRKGNMLVDTGATSHIVTTDVITHVDKKFKPTKHFVELADGTQVNNLAIKRGNAKVILKDVNGRYIEAVLKDALFIPSFPQNIFSVQSATSNGAKVIFCEGQSKLIYKDGTTFTIEEQERLYYLSTFEQSKDSSEVSSNYDSDKINLAYDIYRWHEILGHCNFEDIVKSQNVVNGMNISSNIDKSKLECDVCTEGKFTKNRNRTPDVRATSPLELVHTDLAGPIEPVAKEGFKYCIAFTDDFSGAVFVYFLKYKTDTVLATQKFLADCSPYGQVKCIRSDNGSEFIGNAFQTLLREKGIRHETSCPHSPHQNGTAERHWRTLFEMARCLLIEKGVPKYLWPYAVQTAAHIRNRCYNNRIQHTPYYVLTGRKPDLSKMWVFGSDCYTYDYNHKKLDPRGIRGVFLGYDKNSPAYLIYHPNSHKVSKHRLVKFLRKNNVEHSTQTDTSSDDLDFISRRCNNTELCDDAQNDTIFPDNEINKQGESFGMDNEIKEQDIDDNTQTKSYPQRERRTPQYLETDTANFSIDCCYMVDGQPQTYADAINSPHAAQWEQAMRDEISSLEENDTFELTSLPPGKTLVGGKWVYALKDNVIGSKTFKARYVAKGYSQVKGIDYQETFAPTASITSVRVLMQMAAQYNLAIHQMDVKAAYLHAPIDQEIFMGQPEGFEKVSEEEERLVLKLKKSLYGLKQSGRNWNVLLHNYLESSGFTQNPVDHCVYRKDVEQDVIIVIVWVDDLIIASSNLVILNQFKENMKIQFKMKDLGEISCFLGIDFEQKDGIVKMNQKRYILKILDRFGMADCKPRKTPCEQNLECNNEQVVDVRKYREIVGSLIYAMTCTRPDIGWIVSKLSQKLSNPRAEDMIAAKHVLQYLKGTVDYELCYRKCENELNLIAYSDSDWGSCLEDRRSTTGYCFSLTENGPLIAWKSKKQATVALSTCEAEYIALAATTQESLYLSQLLNSMDYKLYRCTKIHGDNQGAIALSKNPVGRQRSKHIDIKYHFLRNILSNGNIDIVYCPTEHMVADIFTKPATKVKINKFKTYLFGY